MVDSHRGSALRISYLGWPDSWRISRHRGIYFMVKIRFLRNNLVYVACHWLEICCTTAQSPLSLGISSHGLNVVLLRKRVDEDGTGRQTASLPNHSVETYQQFATSAQTSPSISTPPHKAASCLSLILAKICRPSSRNK